MERDCSDEHEEGEIIDDFEDISDYSMPSSSNSGKSVSHRDLLQDVSLSSISDNEQDSLLYINTYKSLNTKHHKRKSRTVHHRRKKRQKSNDYYSRHRLSKYVSSSSRTSSSDLEIDPKTQKQLKDAVHIEKSHIHHNSLRTRLKAMLQNENLKGKSEDEDEDTLRTLALLSHSKDDAIGEEKNNNSKLDEIESADDKDEELIELRLAALKSAVLRKVPEIRKRKFKQKLMIPSEKICEINKENDVNQENNIKEDINIINKESDEFQIIHNNIEIPNETSKNITIEEDIDIMRAKLLASMSKKITDAPTENVYIKIPKENKLDIRNTKLITQPKQLFLKQQKKVKPIIINLNDSDSDTDITSKKDQNDVKNKDINLVNSVSEFLRKQRAAVEAKAKESIAQVKSNVLDKSVLKLLSKSQQKEYRLLKQKLLIARKKRIRKNSLKNENNISVMVKRNVKEAIPKEDALGKQQQESKSNGLQEALLDDIQVKRNGRLQMKGKYKALAPLLQKVNQASVERKQCELEIKTLLSSLQKARDRFAVSHQSYTNLVMRLTAQKNVIDLRINKTHMKIVNNNAIVAINGTSTPLKSSIQESVCDISSIHNSQDNVKVAENTEAETKDIPSHAPCNNDPLAKCDKENNTLKLYVSPLDSKNRDTVEDPLITFCPFELFGVCKDPECKFNHCSKS